MKSNLGNFPTRISLFFIADFKDFVLSDYSNYENFEAMVDSLKNCGACSGGAEGTGDEIIGAVWDVSAPDAVDGDPLTSDMGLLLLPLPTCNNGFTEGSAVYQGDDDCLEEDNDNYYYDEGLNTLKIGNQSVHNSFSNLTFASTPFNGVSAYQEIGNEKYYVKYSSFGANLLSSAPSIFSGSGMFTWRDGGGAPDAPLVPSINSQVTKITSAVAIANGTYSQSGTYTALFRGLYLNGQPQGRHVWSLKQEGDGTWNFSREFRFREDGYLQSIQMGAGNFGGVPTYDLAVDASGNFIEVAPGTIPSDETIKSNISDIDDNPIYKLKPKVYDKQVVTGKDMVILNQAELDGYEGDGRDAPIAEKTEVIQYGITKEYGFIAQVLETHIPDAVKQTGQIKSIQYYQIIPLLVDALQKQDERIKSLEEQIEAVSRK